MSIFCAQDVNSCCEMQYLNQYNWRFFQWPLILLSFIVHLENFKEHMFRKFMNSQKYIHGMMTIALTASMEVSFSKLREWIFCWFLFLWSLFLDFNYKFFLVSSVNAVIWSEDGSWMEKYVMKHFAEVNGLNLFMRSGCFVARDRQHWTFIVLSFIAWLSSNVFDWCWTEHVWRDVILE